MRIQHNRFFEMHCFANHLIIARVCIVTETFAENIEQLFVIAFVFFDTNITRELSHCNMDAF